MYKLGNTVLQWHFGFTIFQLKASVLRDAASLIKMCLSGVFFSTQQCARRDGITELLKIMELALL